MDLNRQVQKAFQRLESFYQCDLPSQELTARLLSELNSALHELQTTAVELLEQNEEMAANRQILEEERCRYQDLFDLAPDGYLVTDIEGIILEANVAAINLFSVSKAFFIGNPLAIFVPSEERLSFRTRLACITSGIAMQKENWVHNILSGKRTTFPVSITVEMVISTRCKTSQLLWCLRDITDLRRYEKELARLDRLNVIGEMSASIAHEIRNPMTSVKGFLQLFKTKPHYSEDRENIDLMIEEIDRANAIITEFLSLAKNKTIDLKPENLNLQVRTLLPLLSADATKKDIHIKLELDNIAAVMIDKDEIRQLILNLVLNGIDAMSTGGELKIKTYKDANGITLAIQDQGHGMIPEVFEKLGTPFFTTKINGTGLGLPVCYSIAQRHNATIDVETSPGGTIFKVTFPS